MAINLYGGRCSTCGVFVPPKAGHFANGKLLCRACVGTPQAIETAGELVRITSAGDGMICAAPAGYLDPERALKFRAACELVGLEDGKGARKVGPILELPALLRRLKVERFVPELVNGVTHAAHECASSLRRRDGARTRIAAELAGRGLRLLRFQPDGVAFLLGDPSDGVAHLARFLADDMGLGKTVQVCAALSQLDRVALMVVSPAGVVHGWRRELTKWTTLEPRLVTRSSMRWPSAGQAILCSYDAARVGALKLGPAPKPDECTLVLVIDEVHRCKGARSAQTKACRAVAQAVDRSGGRAWLLSGTPLKNDHRELWNVLEVCGLGTVAFGSRERFAALATVEPEAYASRLRRVMLRRRKEDVLKDLPPIVPQDIQVELTEEVRAELDRVLSRIVEAAVSSARQRARRIASEAGISADLAEQQAQDAEQRARDDVGEALRMVLAGEAAVPFELISRAKALLSAAKLPSCLELLEDLAPSAEDPVVVFSAGAAVVSELGARDGWARIDGEVTGTARQKVIDRFARGELAGVAISIRAGGEGLDGLQRRASRAILNDREWTPADNAQAIGRLHRFGQQRSVHVYRLIAQHPLDERITELCEEKQATFAEAIDVIAQRGAGTDQKSMLAVLAEELEAAVGVPIVALPAAAAPAPEPVPAAPAPALEVPEAQPIAPAPEPVRTPEKIDAPPVVPATAAKQVVMPWGPHAPASDVERWAIDGLHKLVARTGRWSVRDTASQLLKDLKKQGGLTPEKWTWALRLCRGNPAIVGPEPIGSAK